MNYIYYIICNIFYRSVIVHSCFFPVLLFLFIFSILFWFNIKIKDNNIWNWLSLNRKVRIIIYLITVFLTITSSILSLLLNDIVQIDKYDIIVSVCININLLNTYKYHVIQKCIILYKEIIFFLVIHIYCGNVSGYRLDTFTR